jgi:hypothetical protein
LRIPTYLGIAQWALLLALAVLVIVMYRQLGWAFHRPRSGHEVGPPVGSAAASIEYTRLADDSLQHVTPGDGEAAMVAFVDATCPSCERLVEALGAAHAAGELADVRVLLLVSDPPSYLQISDAFQNTGLEIGQIRTRATVDAYRASATPLLVAIDRMGIVRAAAPAVHVSEVRAFSRACLTASSETATLSVVAAGDGSHKSEATGPVAERN